MRIGLNASVSAPYPEGAAMALLRVWESELLGRRSFVRAQPQTLLHPAASRAGLRQLATRVQPRGVRPNESGIEALGAVPELVRSAVFGLPLAARLRSPAMYFSFDRFDRAVECRLDEPSVLLGLPAACRRTFARNRALLGCNAFHAVNAHPRAQNEVLTSTLPERTVRRELVPPRVVDRIEQELVDSHLLLSPSGANTAGFLAHGYPADRVVQVPYAVDLASFRPQPHRDRPHGPTVSLLFVGQIGYRKGVAHLVAAMRRLTGSHQLDMYGPVGAPELLHDLPANVTYHGLASRGELPNIMNQADAFVLPSLEDACALVTLEAAACGLPVITTLQNGAAELLPARSLTAIEPADASAIVAVARDIAPLSEELRTALASDFRHSYPEADWSAYARIAWTRIFSFVASRRDVYTSPVELP